MAIFGKKEACPVCGGEVKGLMPVKIGGKKTICKDCARQISMDKTLLENATPEFIREHLEYRKQNAEKYAKHDWQIKFTSLMQLTAGVDVEGRAVYLAAKSISATEENPVVLSFDQITGYSLYRGKKKLDGMEDTGDIPLETGISALGGIARALNSKSSSDTVDNFHIKLTTTEPYWREMDIKIEFASSQLYSFAGPSAFGQEMKQFCGIIKSIIRKEPITVGG